MRSASMPQSLPTFRLLEGHVQRTPDQSEPERKTLEAMLKSMPQGFIATLDQLADCLAKA